ncbi:Hypp6519 [Branchiostoma lanceolatum]|uniref:Hypp6519 protein n=1 Tax=Branchiostoma lanceolatum TaxID=7740 RepID=A0A8K0E735_BRALA|nr:Hypp6519 [Branchiostoma lanceolatum]
MAPIRGRRRGRSSTTEHASVSEEGLPAPGAEHPPSPRPPKPPKLTMKTLQQQLNDLQQVTARLVDKLEAGPSALANPAAEQGNTPNTSTPGLTSATITVPPYIVPTTSSGLPMTSRVVTSSAPPITSVPLPAATTTSGMLPIYSSTMPIGLQPPALPPLSSISQGHGLVPGTTYGLGTTLASNIMGLGEEEVGEAMARDLLANLRSAASSVMEIATKPHSQRNGQGKLESKLGIDCKEALVCKTFGYMTKTTELFQRADKRRPGSLAVKMNIQAVSPGAKDRYGPTTPKPLFSSLNIPGLTRTVTQRKSTEASKAFETLNKEQM